MRKLVWAACGYAGALLLSHYLLPYRWLLSVAIAFGILTFAALLLRGGSRRRAMLVCAAAALGFFWTWAYTALFVQPAEQYVGETRTVTVRVEDYADVYEDYSRIEVRCIDDEIPHTRMIVYDYASGMGELCPGDIAEMELKFLSASLRYNEESDYYLSSGIRLRGYIKGGCTVTGRAVLSWLYFPQTLARTIKEQALACFPADVAPLMKALLTGDKREYYADDALYSAMRTAGFTHIVAVSGMHVAFIISVLSLWTGRRRRAAFLGVPMVVVFMAMVGFTPSVVRAGIMQILLLVAPLLRRENDAPTSLAFALLLLLLINPIAIGSISLQLSFAAMTGLILVAPRVYNWLVYDQMDHYRLPKGLFGRLLRSVCAAVSASVGAMIFSAPIAALWFGYVPLYSILTNLLCLWVMSTAFIWGYAVCLLGLIWQPLGCAAGWILGWLPRYAVFVVKRIANLPYAAVYTRGNMGGWWLMFVYAVFTISYTLRGDQRYRPIIPICICFFTFSLLTLFTEKELTGKMEFTAVDVGQGQSLVVLTENGTVVIDCGSTGGAVNAGDAAAEYLQKSGRGEIDLLVLTHFHADHANGVKRLMSHVTVDRLAISPECERSEYINEILDACTYYGTEVWYIEENTDITVDDLTLTLYTPLGSEDANEECLLIYGDYGDYEFLVTGDAGSGVEKLLAGFYDLGDMELLVVGHHGSKYSTCEELLDAITPEKAIISVGAGNSYGHPTEEVLQRLEARNIEILRTDQDGTISVTVGIDDGKEQ